MPERVMVLEDEPLLIELLTTLLGMEGYEVSLPNGFNNLLEDVRTARPDAVLIDVNLKGANGLDLLGQIRADQELKNIFVVLSSGMDYRQQSLQQGANGFLLKPYTPSDLVELLRAQFGN